MNKYCFAVFVLVSVCISWGQDKNDSVSVQNVKDSIVTTSVDSVSKTELKIDSGSTVADTLQKLTSDTSVATGSQSDSIAAIMTDSSSSAAKTETAKIPDTLTEQKKLADTIAVADSVSLHAADSKMSVNTSKASSRKNGIGLDILCKIFMSSEINDYLDNIYDLWHLNIENEGYTLKDENGITSMIFVPGVTLKGEIAAGSVLTIEPFGMFSYGYKQMKVSNLNRDVKIGLSEASGGCNFWIKKPTEKKVSLKTGLGAYFMYSFIDVNGYLGNVDLKGWGYGLRFLAGLDIKMGIATINFDLSFPVGKTNLEKDGKFNNDFGFNYPDSYSHYGIEIRPGLTFNF